MSSSQSPIVLFLRDLMRRKGKLPSQLASELGVSHATVGRWLNGVDAPSPKSCKKLAEYSGVPLEHVLTLAGHLSEEFERTESTWPEFEEYVRRKYPGLSQELVEALAELVERRTKSRKS